MIHTYSLSSSHNIKIGKDTINNDPEDDEGNTPYQKYQFAPENKTRIKHPLPSSIDQIHTKTEWRYLFPFIGSVEFPFLGGLQ